jgi:hypothetical protein
MERGQYVDKQNHWKTCSLYEHSLRTPTMAMIFDISEIEAVWLARTAKAIAAGVAIDGIGLPAAVLASAKNYYSDVRNVTPPANGGSVASLAFARGKATIDADLYKAFRVVSKVAGGNAAAPLNWYLKRRNSKGRFSGRVRITISAQQFQAIRAKLHKRIGWMQSGWNPALKKFNASIPAWAQNKSAPGSVSVIKSQAKFAVIAKNSVKTISAVTDMKRRINFVSAKYAKRIETDALNTGNRLLKRLFL